MANSKFDAKLERMQYLMGYNNSLKESKQKTNVEYHTLGADNKVYGIVKEGSMYYIKSTEIGKENLLESYSYLNGFDYRNENGYKSYNEATKQLELKLMSLNEAYGKKMTVSTMDSNRGRKNLMSLTEAARKELDRMHQILENSQVIGMNNTGDPESKGEATDPTKQGEPFEEPAKAELDKDIEAEGTVDNATDNTEVEGIEKDLESDEMKTKKVDAAEEGKDAHDDIEGEGVADQHPTGAKAVMVNEGEEDLVGLEDDEDIEALLANDEIGAIANQDMQDFYGDKFVSAKDEENLKALAQQPEEVEDDEDLDSLLEELMGGEEYEEPIEECEELDGPHGELPVQTVEDAKKEEGNSKIEGPDKVLDGPHGSLDVQTIDRITEAVCDKILGKEEKCPKCGKKVCECGKQQKSLQESIDRIVAEEITRLDVFGKHPRFRKEPMTLPKAEGEAYAKKIGKGDPYTELVDAVLKDVKEKLSEGKKSKKA